MNELVAHQCWTPDRSAQSGHPGETRDRGSGWKVSQTLPYAQHSMLNMWMKKNHKNLYTCFPDLPLGYAEGRVSEEQQKKLQVTEMLTRHKQNTQRFMVLM